MKLSFFIGKQILSADGKTGYIVSVNAVGDKAVSLKCVDGNEREFIADIRDVICTGVQVVYKDSLKQVPTGTPVRLGKPVFDYDGKYIGAVEDYILEGNSLAYAVIGKVKISVSDLNLGDAIIIKPEARILRGDVKKRGRVLIKCGTPISDEVIKKAQSAGEYVQTELKSL